MSDFEILKQALRDIKCNFLHSQTLLGYSVIIQPNKEKEIHFEFDNDGKFIRVI